MTALRDRTYRRLEGDVVSAVYRRWGFRRDLIDDLVQIGRLALAARFGGDLVLFLKRVLVADALQQQRFAVAYVYGRGCKGHLPAPHLQYRYS